MIALQPFPSTSENETPPLDAGFSSKANYGVGVVVLLALAIAAFFALGFILH
jgi:hypothetical protein